MKKITLLVLFFIPCLTISAQNIEVKMSENLSIPKKRVFKDHLYSDSQGNHYLYFEGYGKMHEKIKYAVIQKYNKDFILKSEHEYSIPDEKGAESYGVYYFNGKMAWLLSKKEDDNIHYYIQTIGLDGKMDSKIEIARIKYETSRDVPEVTWHVSTDSSQLLVNIVRDGGRTDKDINVFSCVLNSKYEKQWSKKFNLPFTEKKFKILGTEVGNNGNVYMLLKVYESNANYESKKVNGDKLPAYNIVLLLINNELESPKKLPLNLADLFIDGVGLVVDKKGEVNCTGFYSKSKNGGLQGVFFLKLNPDGSVITSSKKTFSDEDLEILGKKNTDNDKDGNKGLDAAYDLKDFLVKSDGSAYVVTEKSYFLTYPTMHKGVMSTYTEYHNLNNIFFSITTDGTIERLTLLPKKQESSSDYYQSHVSMLYKDDLFILYNENKNNLDKPIRNSHPERVADFNSNVAVITTLKKDGELERKTIFSTKEQTTSFIPKKSKQISDNQLFFISGRFRIFTENRFQIGTITISN